MDFIANFTLATETPAAADILTVTKYGTYTLSLLVDGASNPRDTEVGIILISPLRDFLEKSLKYEWRMTNNETEYEELILGRQSIISLGVRFVRTPIRHYLQDYELLVNECKTRKLKMRAARYTLLGLPDDLNCSLYR